MFRKVFSIDYSLFPEFVILSCFIGSEIITQPKRKAGWSFNVLERSLSIKRVRH
jgi:hypothetical protein